MGDEEKAGFLRRGTYSLLKHLRVEIEEEEEKERAFFLCFWLYLVKSIAFPVTLVQKVQPGEAGESPFLVIDEKKVTLFRLPSYRNEASESFNPTSSLDAPNQSLDFEFPLERWVHFGCEVSTNLIRLHIDGKIVGERTLSSFSEKDSLLNGFSKIILASGGGDNKKQGYIYNLKILPTTFSVKDHQAKDLPVKLSMDKSSASEIEEGDGGVWSIVGGKVSCRRNFSLDVVLLDAGGQPVSNGMEVVASLVYLDTGEPVEGTSDGEAPLLASYDGIECASVHRPSKLLHGRASFKLKIAQLSSKCQSRLFRIMFYLPKMETYPFFEAFSPPIRSISRNRNTRVTSLTWRRPTSNPHSISQLSGLGADTVEVWENSLHETKSDLQSKRIRLGPDGISTNFGSDSMLEPPEEECNSHVWTENKVEDMHMGPKNSMEDEESSSDSESTGVRNSDPKSTSSSGSPISDIIVFKYGLAGLTERSLLLKEIANSASDDEILDFADQVSLYSGCSHHRRQIMMTKRLVEEGAKAWNSISENNTQVPWQSMALEIQDRFMKISRSSSRSLSQQDFELLRRISGCQEYAVQENFEQMWCWLYPVAYTLSRDRINELWGSTSPKWIEGFVTKEEAESSLQGPRGVQEPGTFVLRFPTSRSWPHPDAGSLAVTYVGRDYALHHKLLSLDRVYSSAEKEKDAKPLQDLILEEPELSRLGRIIRTH